MNAVKLLDSRPLVGLLGSFALLVGLSACGGSSGGGGGNPPNNNPIAVTCTPTKLGLSKSGSCTVVVKDKAGKPLNPQPQLFFASSDKNIVKIDGFGGFGTYAIGSATITVDSSATDAPSLPVTIEVTTEGASNCGTFTTSKDASGADFNGLSPNPVYAPISFGSLIYRQINCRGDQSVKGQRVIRSVGIYLVYSSLVVGQSYPADISFSEEQVNVAGGNWENTKGTADVRLESINGDKYRFTYSNIVLKPIAGSKGNLTMSGDITATMSQ